MLMPNTPLSEPVYVSGTQDRVDTFTVSQPETIIISFDPRGYGYPVASLDNQGGQALWNDVILGFARPGTTHSIHFNWNSDVPDHNQDWVRIEGVPLGAPILGGFNSVHVGVNQPTDNMQARHWFSTALNQAVIDHPVSFWALYDYNPDPNSGHFHITNGYLLQNNALVQYSGDVPARTAALVSTADINQSTFVGPQIVGVHDDLYVAAFNGQLSNWHHVLAWA